MEHLKDPLRWSTDHRTITNDCDRPLHQLGVFEKQRNYCVLAGVGASIKTEFDEVTVLSNHVGNRIGQLGDDSSKRLFVKGILQILNDCEIDFAFFK